MALYLNGLGPVHNQPADGAARRDATSTTTTTPTVTIGGQNADRLVQRAGPCRYADLYQVNVTVPVNISAGAQSVTCSIGGVSCQTVMLNVQ